MKLNVYFMNLESGKSVKEFVAVLDDMSLIEEHCEITRESKILDTGFVCATCENEYEYNKDEMYFIEEVKDNNVVKSYFICRDCLDDIGKREAKAFHMNRVDIKELDEEPVIVQNDEQDVILPDCEEPTIEEPTIEEPTIEEPTIKEPTIKEEPVFTPQEEQEIKHTMKETIENNLEYCANKLNTLINANNEEYVDGILDMLNVCAIKTKDTKVMTKILDMRYNLKCKRTKLEKDEKKTSEFTSRLKNVVSQACEIVSATLKATGKSALSVGVLLAKIATYTTMSVIDTVIYSANETVDTAKSIGGYYKKDLGKTSLFSKLGRRRKQKELDKKQEKEDFDFFESMLTKCNKDASSN